MNTEADKQAKRGHQRKVINNITPGQITPVVINRNLTTTKYTKKIRRAYASTGMREYVVQNHIITPSVLERID